MLGNIEYIRVENIGNTYEISRVRDIETLKMNLDITSSIFENEDITPSINNLQKRQFHGGTATKTQLTHYLKVDMDLTWLTTAHFNITKQR